MIANFPTMIFWLLLGIPYAYVIARVMSWAFFRTKLQYQGWVCDYVSKQRM